MIRDFDGVAGGDVVAVAFLTGTSALLADSGSYIAQAVGFNSLEQRSSLLA